MLIFGVKYIEQTNKQTKKIKHLHFEKQNSVRKMEYDTYNSWCYNCYVLFYIIIIFSYWVLFSLLPVSKQILQDSNMAFCWCIEMIQKMISQFQGHCW